MAVLRACARLPETVQERVETLQMTWEGAQVGEGGWSVLRGSGGVSGLGLKGNQRASLVDPGLFVCELASRSLAQRAVRGLCDCSLRRCSSTAFCKTG